MNIYVQKKVQKKFTDKNLVIYNLDHFLAGTEGPFNIKIKISYDS